MASKIDEVLNGSNSPRDADKAVFAKSDRTNSYFYSATPGVVHVGEG